MRKFLSVATVLAAITASPALAADTASTQIDASLAPSCDITSQSSNLTLGAVDEVVPGVFTYSCNFIGSPTLTFTSANGGVTTAENGGAQADYGVYLNDAAPSGAPSSWLQASATPQSYTGITQSLAPNSSVSPSFAVGLSEALVVAGTYSDTLTITIAP
jgi:spore coat protein U-like protein